MNNSLYEVLGMKNKRSSLKSVFVTPEFFEGCLVINVEAYDETGYNAINSSSSQFNDFVKYLNQIIFSNFNKINNKTDKVRVNIYGNQNYQYILTSRREVF